MTISSVYLQQLFRVLLAISVSSLFTYIMQGKFYGSLSVSLLIFSFILLQHKGFKWIVYLLALFCSLMLPMALITGGNCITYATVSTVLVTDVAETTGFLQSLPIQLFISGFLALAGFLVLVMLNEWQSKRVYQLGQESLLALNAKWKVALMVIATLGSSYMVYHQTWDKVLKEVYEGFQLMKMDDMPETTWAVTSEIEGAKRYDVYVLVIGESLRRDMVGFYGNRYETTPFLDKSPKVYISDYLSTAVNTMLAVPQILALPDAESPRVREGENIVALANSLGYETSWISSQGFSGKHDISTSRIARYAHQFQFGVGHDFSIVPIFKERLAQAGDKPQFIVLHTVGSHEYPCGMLSQWGIRFETGKGEMENCYLSTVSKTDEFLRRVVDALKENGKSYSLIYQSDHAQNHVKSRDGYKVLRSDKIKQSYQVPFFMISSDMTHTKRVDVQRSAFRFVEYFPTWLGVNTNLTPAGYDIFNTKNDEKVLVLNYQGTLDDYQTKEDGLKASEILN